MKFKKEMTTHMKRIIPYLIILLLGHGATGQEIDLYGFYSNGNPDTSFMKLAQIDPATGTVENIDSIPGIKAYAMGSSTFDQVNRYFTFVGLDAQWTKRLVSWDVDEDLITGQPEVTETINDLQYDMNTTVYYGIGNYISDTILFDTLTNTYIFDYASRFLSVDPASGILTEVALLPELKAIPSGGSTFDANSGRYIVNGIDPEFNDRLFIIDAATGILLSNELLALDDGDYINELEYNNVDDMLYGFYRDNNADIKGIASLDPVTGDIALINELPQVFAFAQGASVFHQQTQSFILYYIDYSNNNKLLTVDVTTGEIVGDVDLDGNFTEIEVDNTAFAMATYHSTTSIREGSEAVGLTVYPNPAEQSFTVQASSPIQLVLILDLSGRISRKPSISNATSLSIETGDLPAGLYLVRVWTDHGVATEKISIR
jgi:hypothetical protein